jgi:hypothetical protein
VACTVPVVSAGPGGGGINDREPSRLMQRFISVIENLAAAKPWLRHRNLEVHRRSRYVTVPCLGRQPRQPFVGCALVQSTLSLSPVPRTFGSTNRRYLSLAALLGELAPFLSWAGKGNVEVVSRGYLHKAASALPPCRGPHSRTIDRPTRPLSRRPRRLYDYLITTASCLTCQATTTSTINHHQA